MDCCIEKRKKVFVEEKHAQSSNKQKGVKAGERERQRQRDRETESDRATEGDDERQGETERERREKKTN